MATQHRDMRTHVKVIGVLIIVFWSFAALAGIGMAGVGIYASQLDPGQLQDPDTGEELPPEVASAIFLVIAFFVIALSIGAIIVGASLLKHKPWSRIGAIVIGALAIPSFPIGTAFGAYTIWALIQDETKWLFGEAPPPGWQRAGPA